MAARSPTTREVARTLTALSAAEIVDAIGARRAPAIVRRAVEIAAHLPSRRLGRALARFDARVAETGLSRAAVETLAIFGVHLEVAGEAPAEGPALVVTNHPGAYDALATMAALGRDDVALVAADRAFLRAMPRLAEHLVFVADVHVCDRAAGMRRAIAWLENGGALVQFGAGAIEPDARFLPRGVEPLAPWHLGTGLFASRACDAGAAIVPSFVSGVHSRRAKELFVVRWAERRGIHTIATLVQAAIPGFRDVSISVRFGAPISRDSLAAAHGAAKKTEMLRRAVLAMAS
ncbi:MAG: hypothetical protein KF819_24320 [Labilithrix sp.]|nr:hypothetical protein [Labilithrix sp.]